MQAVPKADRAELAVQALTEVGVDRIVPWAAERSQVRVSGERGERLLAKWRAWAHEASKQSRRAWFCEVAGVATTEEVAALLAVAPPALVLHEAAPNRCPPTPPSPTSCSSSVPRVASPTPSWRLLLDPARAVRLGDTVLRTSTAGAVAAGVVLAATRWR